MVDGLGEAGAGCVAVPCDVTDPASVEALFARIGGAHGRLDVVFNNAGTNLGATLTGDVSWEDWRRVLSVNLDGAFLIARGAFRMMRAQSPQGGRIINNGSISAHAPRYGLAPYTASKHAVTGLTKAISLDGRAFDIACGQIDIGNAASEHDRRRHERAASPQADGSLAPEPRIDVEHVARSGGADGRPAARRERAVHHDHGDEDALHRARLGARIRRTLCGSVNAAARA